MQPSYRWQLPPRTARHQGSLVLYRERCGDPTLLRAVGAVHDGGITNGSVRVNVPGSVDARAVEVVLQAVR